MPDRIHSLRLPFDFDPDALKRDLDAIRPDEWTAHFNKADYEGDWSGVALRSCDGSITKLSTRSADGNFVDTPLLDRTPYIQQVLSRFHFPFTTVRLLSLYAGSTIREHSDPALQYEEGEIRLHIPIRTSADVRFYLDRRRMMMNEGETWYLDLSRRHRVENRWTQGRVHLVIDGYVNDWVRETFDAAIAAGGGKLPPIEITDFDRFRDLVLADGRLQQELLAVPDQSAFVARAISLGREHGFDFGSDLVESAILQGQKGWDDRWNQA